MPQIPGALDFEASGISSSDNVSPLDDPYAGGSTNNKKGTPPLSPAVMRAAAKSSQRFPAGAGPVGDQGEVPAAIGVNGGRDRPISPRVLAAAELSNQRRLTYKSSKSDLLKGMPPPLQEGDDCSHSTTTDDGDLVYSMNKMKAVRAAMASRSSRMRQTYSIEAVPAFEVEHSPDAGAAGWRHVPAEHRDQRMGSYGRADREFGGRWDHGRTGHKQHEPVEREVVDTDIDQSVPRQSGEIVFMPNAKYGFIRPRHSAGGQAVGGQGKQGDYFFHATEIKDNIPRVGDRVTFQIARPSWSNRILAVRVQIVSSPGTGHGEGELFGNGHFQRGNGGGPNAVDPNAVWRGGAAVERKQLAERSHFNHGHHRQNSGSERRFGSNSGGAGTGGGDRRGRWGRGAGRHGAGGNGGGGGGGGWRGRGAAQPSSRDVTPTKPPTTYVHGSGSSAGSTGSRSRTSPYEARVAAGPIQSRRINTERVDKNKGKGNGGRAGFHARKDSSDSTLSPRRRDLNTKAAQSPRGAKSPQQAAKRGFQRRRTAGTTK